MNQVAKSGRQSRGWGTLRIGAVLALGFVLVATGVSLPNTLPQAEAATQKITALSVRTDPSSVKLGQQTVLRGVLGIKGTTNHLPNQVIRFFMRNAPTDGWTELNKGKISRTRSDGSFAFGFVPSRNVQVLVQFRGTASFAPTSAGSTVSVMIPVTLKVQDNMFSPESFAGSTGTTQSKGMDISLQRSESGHWVTKGAGKVNANGRYSFKVSMSPATTSSTYRLVLANGGKKTTYSNQLQATVGRWTYLSEWDSLDEDVRISRGQKYIGGSAFPNSIYAQEYYTYTRTDAVSFNTSGKCTRITSAFGVSNNSYADARFTFGLTVDTVERFGPTGEYSPFTAAGNLDMQFPRSTIRLGLQTTKIDRPTVSPSGNYYADGVWGNARILCAADFL